MKKLLIATQNKGKFPEIIAELKELPFEFLGLWDIHGLPEDFEVEEPAMTFEGNAMYKAMTIARKTGLLTLAEDSGLEVDALNGRPGVYSKRYSGGTDEDNNHKLLAELDGIPAEKRGAQYQAVIAIYDPLTNILRTCSGVYRGRIARKPRGTNGFGYDPIFFNMEAGKMSAEMTLKEKNAVSHRGKALRKARELLTMEFLP